MRSERRSIPCNVFINTPWYLSPLEPRSEEGKLDGWSLVIRGGSGGGGVLVLVEEGSGGFDGTEEVDAVRAPWFMD